MNKRQRYLVRSFIIIVLVTAGAILAMVHFRDWVNRSEAMRAMEDLSTVLEDYKQEHGSLPPYAFIQKVKQELEGSARLGNLKYRAKWLSSDPKPDKILAYSKKPSSSIFFSDGYVVLRIDGRVQWMNSKLFRKTLSEQRTTIELQTIHEESGTQTDTGSR